MKFKEIIRSKWGWTGAIIGFILYLYGTVKCIALCPSYINYLSSIYTGLPLILPIIGFIIGLILQNIWRKFR